MTASQKPAQTQTSAQNPAQTSTRNPAQTSAQTSAHTPALPIFEAEAIRAAIGFEDLIEPVAQAFAAYSRGLGESPVSMFAPAGPDGDVHVKSAWQPDSPIFVVKVGSWFAARARATGTGASGLIMAFDVRTGDPVALLRDDHHLSDVRTAAAGALATRLLARRDSRTIGVLGSGVQAYLQVLAAAAERPVTEVRIWGRRSGPVDRLAAALRKRLPNAEVVPVATVRDVVVSADILITATASTEPLVEPAWPAPGTHITAVGADDAGKVELAPDCVALADLVVVDSRELTARYGDIAYARGAGLVLRRTPIELGELVAGSAPTRTDDDQITICKLIGLGVQDLAAANVTLERLERRERLAGSAGDEPRATPASALDLDVAR